MRDLLCDFAKQFPILAASLLHRDRHKSRNFREETITDLLMAGLSAFEPLGIYVDFPADESKTGEDMDWEFVDPDAPDGRRYLRLHIQAKRAILSKSKNNPYWYYRELDHAVPKGALKGSQHKLLIESAKQAVGCVPLFMFYHSLDSLSDQPSQLPAVEGVNVMFADMITQNLSQGSWPISDKKVEKLRPDFMPLTEILCFGHLRCFPWIQSAGPMAFVFPIGERFASPGELADRLSGQRNSALTEQLIEIKASEVIPEETKRALELDRSKPRRCQIERPRAIFSTRRVERRF